jgi:CheY-like chemotaxis protein
MNQAIFTLFVYAEYAVFTNGFEVLSALEKGKHFDIYCLDIFMPGFTGIEVAKEIRALDKTAPIVFFHHRGNLLWRAMQ